MCVHGSQAVYCTTELCLSVDKLKKEKKRTLFVYRSQLLKLRTLTSETPEGRSATFRIQGEVFFFSQLLHDF